jgi:hypothetical protein
MSGASIDCDGNYSQLSGKSTSVPLLARRTLLADTSRRMTTAIARAQLVDVSLTRCYHCVTRCVRRAFLLGEGEHNRREWLENRFEELAGNKLVDYTGRLFREGKVSISADLAGIFQRLGYRAQSWQIQIEKLRGDRLLGRFFAASRAKLREIRERLGVRRLVNLKGCPIR